ncbi:MAG: S1/P1 Nuclease [Cytophagales bacterium]|uniref:zinc dependent phospholipase C family protein n=1 Tax=Cyclobacterium marinum TaxID=104 RepID=UPI0030D756DD|nr:S1/P1 Nuclease [Cytophagales bacterium]|tara:strand:- start:34511 stop:35578 length:1068 start_codon:yes stop_codon:yes gene_type:complete
MRLYLFCIFIFFICYQDVIAWGFYAHRLINRQAVFSLPPELMVLFKPNLAYISDKAVNPDRRRYAVQGEAEKHYIDLDVYGDSAIFKLPQSWQEAQIIYGEDSLRKNGISPWSTYLTFQYLTYAFQKKDRQAILKLAADLGHYLGDINVPLHSTENYNGQNTNQHGIHGFWESRLPELYAKDYDLFVGKAEYLTNPRKEIWEAIEVAHNALDSVFSFEKLLTDKFPDDQKYSYENRGSITTRVYSKAFSLAYHQMLAGQVERQMKKTIKLIADFWYSAWILAGQPDLTNPAPNFRPPFEIDSIETPQDSIKNVREHQSLFTDPEALFWKSLNKNLYYWQAFRKYCGRRPRFLPRG